jgi:hypothetical protein
MSTKSALIAQHTLPSFFNEWSRRHLTQTEVDSIVYTDKKETKSSYIRKSRRELLQVI